MRNASPIHTLSRARKHRDPRAILGQLWDVTNPRSVLCFAKSVILYGRIAV
jgi:hypothetical protein